MLKHELRSLFFLPDKHVVLVGELKMPACGLCMAAYKKAALVVKTVCLHKSFSKLHPLLPSVLLSLSFFLLLSPSLNLSETLSLCKDRNLDSCSFPDSNKQQIHSVSL